MTKKDYDELMADRPRKWKPEQVDYREAKGEERCGNCVHMFRRVTDRFAVCELIRSEEIDRVGIEAGKTCDWFTPDGEEFPLQ